MILDQKATLQSGYSIEDVSKDQFNRRERKIRKVKIHLFSSLRAFWLMDFDF